MRRSTMDIKEHSVATVNGKTVTVKKWIAYLTLVMMVMGIISAVFGNVIEPVIWKVDIENTVQETTNRVDKIEVWRDTHEAQSLLQNNINNKQLHELQLNLKVLMEKSGLTYQSITN